MVILFNSDASKLYFGVEGSDESPTYAQFTLVLGKSTNEFENKPLQSHHELLMSIQSKNTHFVRGSITVQLTSGLTSSDVTKPVNLLFI